MTFFKKKSNQPLLVGICGWSCSGKGELTEALASVNCEVLLLQADYYFRENTSCTYKGYPCIEHTDCISFDRLIDNLRSLKEGKDIVIRNVPSWMHQDNIEISHEDILKKKIIIIDGFLIFAIRELVDLFDYRVFIHASNYNILVRRLKRDGFGQFNYIIDVVIAVSQEYEQIQTDNADLIIDGDKSKEELIDNAGRCLNEQLSQSDADFRLGLPPKKSPWKVHFGDLLTDHEWHPIGFEDLKDWVKEKKDRLDIGEELKGNTFKYRRNPNSGTYEVRLRHRDSHNKIINICRYTREPT
jgi:uridine kinase